MKQQKKRPSGKVAKGLTPGRMMKVWLKRTASPPEYHGLFRIISVDHRGLGGITSFRALCISSSVIDTGSETVFLSKGGHFYRIFKRAEQGE